MVREGKGWKVASLSEVPALGNTADIEWFKQWDREDADPNYGERWHSVRHFLGAGGGFGINAYETDAGRELVIEHTETGKYGDQEELYVLVEGRAKFVCDGSEIELGAGDALYVRADVPRKAIALESPTIYVAVGGTPGAPYRHWTGT